ncbi:UNVERIFIED_CONTAM: hypothetical protein GTU68_012079 [Idotea baltica]|nr:hypothetical protein [Idotea baltica]
MLEPFQGGVLAIDVNRDEFVPDSVAIELISESVARQHCVLPVVYDSAKRSLLVAIADPNNVTIRDALRQELDQLISIEYRRASVADIKQTLDTCYGRSYSLEQVLTELHSQHDVGVGGDRHGPATIIRLVDALLQDALVKRASDIHLSPEVTHVQIRYRIDGVLQIACCLHVRYWPAMLVRIKVLSEMDIAETRLPQDGHLTRHIHGTPVDFRVASFPVRSGENLVLRVLDKQRGLLSLQALCNDQDERKLKALASKPHGLVLVCGPTGSGKTTTLYAMLQSLDAMALNIMTLEDPVEYPMLNIRQTRVQGGASFDFAQGVRGVLRQDPDVLLVGEVRDVDSCAMTCRAALTGHLVFTSTHANDSISAIARLLELGAQRATIASVLSGVVSQRLIRKLCTGCTQGSVACVICNGTGFNGRLALFECLMPTPDFIAQLVSGADFPKLHEQAINDGMVTMLEQAQRYVRNGQTTESELQRVFGAMH